MRSLFIVRRGVRGTYETIVKMVKDEGSLVKLDFFGLGIVQNSRGSEPVIKWRNLREGGKSTVIMMPMIGSLKMAKEEKINLVEKFPLVISI